MREIKFRGKRTDGKGWVYGCYVNHWRTKQHGITCGEYSGVLVDQEFEVDPETVGQFIGHQDKNGVDVYEGDPLRWIDKDEVKTGVMGWDESAYGFRVQMPKGYFPSFKLLPKDIEVIGNIHDK